MRVDDDVWTQQDRDDFSPIPPGSYEVVCIDHEVKTTKAGNGEYVSLTFEILDGQFAKRRLWFNFNWTNPSLEAMRIGRQQFKQFINAAGLEKVADTEESVDLTCIVEVDIDPKDATRNRIKRFTSRKAAQAQAAAKKPIVPAPVSSQNPFRRA